MNVNWMANSVGTFAGLCTTLSMVPQLYSIWRRKSARDVSLFMFLVFGLGVVLWLTYGIAIKSAPVIVANGATLVLVIAILTLKLYYDSRP